MCIYVTRKSLASHRLGDSDVNPRGLSRAVRSISINDGVWIYCNQALGGDARGRGDCVSAPDIYTAWVHANGYAQNGFCLFSMRGTIMETRVN
jgi:hypothetical protein